MEKYEYVAHEDGKVFASDFLCYERKWLLSLKIDQQWT